MTRRLLIALATASLLLAGVALAAGFPVSAGGVTVVRIAGAIPAKTCTITAVADAHVDEAAPDTTAGTAAALEVTAGPADRRALVRFDIGSCGIPAGAQVRTAGLRMVLVAAPATGRTWAVHRVTSAWTGLAVTWSSQPTVHAVATANAPTGTAAGATLEWNVLPDVADVVSGAVTDSGWRIADADESAPATVGGALASREAAADRPSLTITWFD